jgi:hypothetical protein
MKTFKDLEFVPIRDGHQGVTSTMFFDNHYGVFVNRWEGSVNAQQGVLADLYELTIIDKLTNKLVHSIPPHDTVGHLTEEEVTDYMLFVQKL